MAQHAIRSQDSLGGTIFLLVAAIVTLCGAAFAGYLYYAPTLKAQSALDGFDQARPAEEMAYLIGETLFYVESDGVSISDLTYLDANDARAPLTCEGLRYLVTFAVKVADGEGLDYKFYADMIEPLELRIHLLGPKCPDPPPVAPDHQPPLQPAQEGRAFL